VHKLLEREGFWRAGALLIGQEHFDRLLEQGWLSCGLDRLETGLRCVPAITPTPHGFIAYVQVLRNLTIADPPGCF
jgi:hypothetical protein